MGARLGEGRLRFGMVLPNRESGLKPITSAGWAQAVWLFDAWSMN